MPGPLHGLLVLDLTRVLAGPYCTMVLADLGARVIKIEAPGLGDDARHIGPFVDGESAYFASINRAKESIALDLKAEADVALFHRMAARADVLVENFRPGAMARRKLSYEHLRERHPRLVYAAVSGFGQTGPDSARPAYDMIVQAMGGIMSVTGHPGGPPTRVGTSVGDITAGLFTAIGIQAALLERERTGRGQLVDVAMLDCQIAILENAVARTVTTGVAPGPLGARHPSITPFAAYQTADRPIVIAAGNDALFRSFSALLEADWPADARFATNAARTENADALAAGIEAKLAARPAAEWLAALEAAGIPAGPLNDVKQALANPQIAARNMLIETAFPGGSALKAAGNPVKLSAHDDPPSRPPAPRLDADAGAIRAEFAA